MNDLLIHVTRRAMASEFEVRFPAERYQQGTTLAMQALDLVEALEEQISYFRPTSELSRINRLAADEPIEVAPSLFDLLRLAMSLYEATEGAYDVTSAPLWEAWGFARRKGEVPSKAELDEAKLRVGGHLVELDPTHRTIRFRQPGVRINLGSIGKGHALDVCGEQLSASGMADFLLHGGQSSILARGNRTADQGPAEPQPWEIGIRHPRQPGRRLGIVRLHNRALGTSSGHFQSFRHRGRLYGHILDPRSGWPAEGVLSATVMAPSAALADALSTAFYVMGPDRAMEYCQTHPEVGMVLICPNPSGEEIEIHTAGLDTEDIDLGSG